LRQPSELGHSFFDPEVRSHLPHYYKVLLGERPPKYRLAKAFPVSFHQGAQLEELLEAQRAAAPAFADFSKGVYEDEGRMPPSSLSKDRSYLGLKAAIAEEALKACSLCEWKCGVDRHRGRGFCRLSDDFRLGSFFLHFGEEPPLVGARGSGTIFFTGCNFRCVHCQNYDISQDPSNGAPVDPRRLSHVLKHLSSQRCLNFNFVGGEPTPSLPLILSALTLVDEDVPVLWNSNMYMSELSMDLLGDIVDIWLPDFKYGNDECALKLSCVSDYMRVVSRNHLTASRQGDMIIRVLLLPGHWVCCGRPTLDWIKASIPNALVNIMGQYHPDYLVLRKDRFESMCRPLSQEELRLALGYADGLGLKYRGVV
jgi:putative pyruvate formate lyase activating enzyme